MGIFSKLKLVFTYGPELEDVLRDKHNEAYLKELVAKGHHLNLCTQHKQEERHSHFAEHNCDYCNALKGKFRLHDTRPKGVSDD